MTLEFAGAATPLGPADIASAASDLGLEQAAIYAVCEIESPEGGFLPDGRPTILFESHVFHTLTQGRYDQSHSGISTPNWVRNYGAGGPHQYDRLAEAIALDRNAALQAASWGKFQTLGENYRECGFPDPEGLVAAMCQNEAAHLMAFGQFCRASGALAKLKSLDFAGFARIYNGAGYAANQYDTKLAAAYRKWKSRLEALPARAAAPGPVAPSQDHLSPHFTFAELVFSDTAKRRGIDNDPSGDPEIMANLTALATDILEPLRAQFGPFSPNSGYRSPRVNAAVGGAAHSQHMAGQAADLRVPSASIFELAEWCASNLPAFDQIILEWTWVHISYVKGGPNRRQLLTINSTTGGYVSGLHGEGKTVMAANTPTNAPPAPPAYVPLPAPPPAAQQPARPTPPPAPPQTTPTGAEPLIEPATVAPVDVTMANKLAQAINTVPMTGSAALVMTPVALIPLVNWALTGFKQPPPAEASYSVVALLVIVAHGVQKMFGPWWQRHMGASL